MQQKIKMVGGILILGLLSACVSVTDKPAAQATLAARSASTVSGDIRFSPMNGGLKIIATVSGLTPGEHGFHIHEVGDCSAADASSAKGHFNPTGKMHGHHDSANRHGGDMPNLLANAQGEARLSTEVNGLTISEVVGRSIVIHADPDDYKSQPAGNSGKRVACGVIVAG